MKRKNINDVTLYCGELFGKVIYFTEERIDRRDLPNDLNMYVYELRHDDDGDWTTPVEICNSVMVNFCMTVISNEPLQVDLTENYVMIHDGDFVQDFYAGYKITEPDVQAYFDCHNTQIDFSVPSDRIYSRCIKKPIKLFISQPFTGYDDNEIAKQRKLLHQLYAKYINKPLDEVVLLEQHLPEDAYDIPCNFESEEQHQFYYFCRSVGIMSKADVVLFYGDWYKSKGASLENTIVMSYGMKHLEQDELIGYCKSHPELDDEFFMPLWKKQFFDMHELADVNITRCDNRFKAVAKLDNGFCEGYGESPNDAYMTLYSLYGEKIRNETSGGTNEDTEISE